jgi:hypothetical protein
LIDVSPSIRATAVSDLVRLGPDEHVIAIDDKPVANDLAAGAAISAHASRHEDVSDRDAFIDVSVRSPTGPRRVLLLLH